MARITFFALVILSILIFFTMAGFAANNTTNTTSFKNESQPYEFNASAPIQEPVETSSHLFDNELGYDQTYFTEEDAEHYQSGPHSKNFRKCTACVHECFRVSDGCVEFGRCVKRF